MTNILILSAGRRVELTNCFKAARDRLGIKGKVIAADCSPLAPALYFADSYEIVPRISEGEAYVKSIIDICRKEDVSLVVPTIDTELMLLAENKARIEYEGKCRVLISDKSVVEICRNKLNTQIFFEEHGFLVPHLYIERELEKGDYDFPLFIKPLDGSSSIDAYKVENEEELRAYMELIDRPMVQAYMEGEEYTIDCFLDFAGELLHMVPRVRIATRSGEIAKGRIVRDEEIEKDVRRLMEELSPIGHITVQCRKTRRGVEYIEINPRFGGGAPMSIMAGADSCEKLYRLLAGEELTFSDDFRTDVTFLRFDASIMLDENGNYDKSGSI
ncbi:MAG: ATP-grasp domain-containing protein [Lachnospiraceae bacterium]|nr:ATP-grasp domain-containing protein [Lachnospiraceae bacterium]